tara:strand:+ start:104 stop:1198 length:1095 start_codon:yes stop_codon:yes gene_type:complete
VEIISRKEAKEKGLVHYFTGKPCPNGHLAKRNTKNTNCTECSRLRKERWLAAKESGKKFIDTRRYYTKEEDDYLKKNYLTKSKEEMGKDLNRTYKSIEKRLLNVLKLKKTYEDMGSTRRKESGERNSQTRLKLKGKVPDDWFNYPSSHDEATQSKSDYYFSGRKCENGHFDLRRTAGRGCLACNRDQASIQRKNPIWKEWRRQYRKKPEIRKKEYAYQIKRMQEDPAIFLRHFLSSRIANAMQSKGRYKPAKSEEIIGTSWKKFLDHLEKQFDNNMTFENHGIDGWHLDHVRPCASFDLLDDEQVFVCFNWRNYQPMWGVENMSKSDDYSKEDEIAWIKRMRDFSYEGELFLKYQDGVLKEKNE